MKWVLLLTLSGSSLVGLAQIPILTDSVFVTDDQAMTVKNQVFSEQELEALNDMVMDQTITKSKLEKFDINKVNEEQLSQLGILSPVQITGLVNYRSLLGEIKEMEEMQAIPFWDLATIEKIVGHLMIGTAAVNTGILKIWKKEEQLLQLVSGMTLQQPAGFEMDSSNGKRHYLGPPVSLMIKLTHKNNNGMHWGLMLENDKGESFAFKKNQYLFDHVSKSVSFHFGNTIKLFVIGDYQINLGLGLTHWQSYGLGRSSADINAVVNYAPVIKSYCGRGEDNYHSGLAYSLERGKWSFYNWASRNKKDAAIKTDSAKKINFITSIIEGGLHRSEAEMQSRGGITEVSAGVRIAYNEPALKVGFNAIGYQWSHPILSDTTHLYKQFSFQGNRLFNCSLDFKYIFKGLYSFGELSYSFPGGGAWVSGCIISFSEKMDMALIYRNISKKYESRYASSFNVSYKPRNESGISILFNYKLTNRIKLIFRADYFKCPWINFGEQKMKLGKHAKLALIINPKNQYGITMAYSFKSADNEKVLSSLNHYLNTNQQMHQFEIGMQRRLTNYLAVNFQSVLKSNHSMEWGYMFGCNLMVKWPAKSIKFGTGVTFFHTTGFENRLYLVENELFSTPRILMLYDQGWSYRLNFEKKLSTKLSMSFYVTQNQYFNKGSIGSGNDLIRGSQKTDIFAGIKWQL